MKTGFMATLRGKLGLGHGSCADGITSTVQNKPSRRSCPLALRPFLDPQDHTRALHFVKSFVEVSHKPVVRIVQRALCQESGEGEAMKCRKCQFENPAGVKFCGECGTELTLPCPSCQASNPPQFKFCGECGYSLIPPQETRTQKDLSFDEKLAKIQRYLPSGLTEKILSQRDRIEGERRQVTIMFVDMKGFTPLTEKIGPEETFALMDQVFEILIHKIHEYEGTVNERRGDEHGLLAGQSAGGIGKIVEKPSGLKELLPCQRTKPSAS
jgi:ribosomal protein L40E